MVINYVTPERYFEHIRPGKKPWVGYERAFCVNYESAKFVTLMRSCKERE
jgi:hypothetical protein